MGIFFYTMQVTYKIKYALDLRKKTHIYIYILFYIGLVSDSVYG